MVAGIEMVSSMLWTMAGLLLVLIPIKFYIEREQWCEFFAVYFSGENGEFRKVAIAGISGAIVIVVVGLSFLYQITN
ncbi:hypothetical protein ABER99_21310 [Paenibacillus glucanolyticus]|jgi:hypothetical protein|uniref:Uncharacterized protein n=1 Tax=Paenibacillus glucanolyticus TaxID=59843 RepID=A0A163G6W2_9BACL|nr:MULTISPECIES: hypothetical protein [Paenibacillus]KZS44766.1 hypothetical protein AWU65_01885 [Paenibacillus glucanolyticus]MDH6675641.1 hypothetical protein [Paenibacillus sp. LBL]OMF64757.1 hypothetical protein BK142_31720 [Paenibacillus glucanolyticus]